MKHILITGASGFVGKYLSQVLLSKGYQITGLGTSKVHPLLDAHDKFNWISADTTQAGSWQDVIGQADAIINLAGRNIFRYWTEKYKQAIYDSRVKTTANIVDALNEGSGQKLLSASAVGIYGDRKDVTLSEDSDLGNSFLAQVCKDWEMQAKRAEEKSVSVSILRFGVVLGDGGALAKMIPAFKFFAGGPLGGGRHWFPWIHIRDLAAAVCQILEDDSFGGTFNLTAPGSVRQKDFAKALGKALKRPSFVPTPAVVIRLLMGELGASLLQSQHAVPQRLTECGYSFLFPDVNTALEDILRK